MSSVRKILYYSKNPLRVYNSIVKRRNAGTLKYILHDARRNNIPLYNLIRRIVEDYTSGGGFEYERYFQMYKLYHLHMMLLKYKPGKILELGSGGTSSIIVNFIQSCSKKISADCLEESAHWFRNTEKIIKKLNKQVPPSFRLIHCGRIVDQKKPFVVTRYDFDYTEKYDMVIIDGPTNDPEETDVGIINPNPAELYTTDFFKIAEKYLPEVVLIDNRNETLRRILGKFGDKYNVTETYLAKADKKLFGVRDLNHYTILELRKS